MITYYLFRLTLGPHKTVLAEISLLFFNAGFLKYPFSTIPTPTTINIPFWTVDHNKIIPDVNWVIFIWPSALLSDLRNPLHHKNPLSFFSILLHIHTNLHMSHPPYPPPPPHYFFNLGLYLWHPAPSKMNLKNSIPCKNVNIFPSESSLGRAVPSVGSSKTGRSARNKAGLMGDALGGGPSTPISGGGGGVTPTARGPPRPPVPLGLQPSQPPRRSTQAR